MTDIVPELLEAIKKDFEKQRVDSKKIQALLKLLEEGQATYKDAHAYAVEVGEILSKVLNVHITAETLPDGKMYFNIADRVLNETLKNNYSLVSDYTEGVQTRLNQQAGLKLRAQRPDFDQDRVKGFVNKLSSADDFADVQWVLGDPMVNFTQSVVDEAIKKNAKFHSDAGMKSVIKRQVKGKACKWCRGLEGTYDYPKGTPNEVFHRHENCRCVTEYYPSDKKKKQDVWSKEWRNRDVIDKITTEKPEDISNTRKIALRVSIPTNPIERVGSRLEADIIADIGGGDLTKGSCSSAAFAYAGAKSGYRVLDFRGGASQDIFSNMAVINDIAKLPGVKSQEIRHKNDFSAVKQLLKNVEEGKEYYLATGQHAAIVKKVGDEYQYLELQSYNYNGFYTLNDQMLKKRFGCQKSHTHYGQRYAVSNTLIDIDSLGKSEEFKKILSFINTADGRQMKGIEGHVK